MSVATAVGATCLLWGVSLYTLLRLLLRHHEQTVVRLLELPAAAQDERRMLLAHIQRPDAPLIDPTRVQVERPGPLPDPLATAGQVIGDGWDDA
jgi:hypothetical protein